MKARRKVPFTQLYTKILGINFMKEMNLHENYETLLKEIKREDLKKWKDVPKFLVQKINIVEMAIFPN